MMISAPFGATTAEASALVSVRISGADARAFLQGQLSNDVGLLTRNNTQLAAVNTPQGRVIALLRLIERSDGIHALVPSDLAVTVCQKLGRYILRSKVTIALAQDLVALPLTGARIEQVAAQMGASGFPGPERVENAGHLESDGVSLVRLPGPVPRALLLGTASALHPFDITAASDWNAWHLAQIAAGEPQVLAATSEAFVAQMLNLDLVDGISFNKGCYTGQEIIVRTQHLGRIKRRMLRARAAGAPVAAGTRVLEGSEPVGTVVLSAASSPDATDLLAVVNLSAAERPLHLEEGQPLKDLTAPYPLDPPAGS